MKMIKQKLRKIDLMIITTLIVKCIIAVAAVAGATYLALHEKEGWGWLIFLAIVAVL